MDYYENYALKEKELFDAEARLKRKKRGGLMESTSKKAIR